MPCYSIGKSGLTMFVIINQPQFTAGHIPLQLHATKLKLYNKYLYVLNLGSSNVD